MAKHAKTENTKPEDQAKRPQALPEAVRFTGLLWVAIIILEAIHQCLSIAMTIMNRPETQAALLKAIEKREQPVPSESIVQLAFYGSVLIVGGISLVIISVLSWLTVTYLRGAKRSDLARRVLTYFSVYFGLRATILFLAVPSSSHVPVAMYAVDGCLQILIGVLAVTALLFSTQKDSLEHTGEMDQIREILNNK